jgi:hypothetical protein
VSFKQANSKTVCQCDLCGIAAFGNATSAMTSPTDQIDGIGVTCFNYCTSTLIQSVSFTSFQGTLSGGGDLQVSGTGTAMVNGVSTSISLTATVISGIPSVFITNGNSGQLLAGGIGESGLAGFGLDILTA